MHTEHAFQAKHTFNLIIVMFESEICISDTFSNFVLSSDAEGITE